MKFNEQEKPRWYLAWARFLFWFEVFACSLCVLGGITGSIVDPRQAWIGLAIVLVGAARLAHLRVVFIRNR